MKVWIEHYVDMDHRSSFFFHSSEPQPVSGETSGETKAFYDYWWQNGTENELGQRIRPTKTLKRLIPKGTVAEFELACIWERVK